MPYANVGISTGLRPRVGQIGRPLNIRFEEMKRNVEMAIPVGQPERAIINSMMSEIAIDQMEDAIASYRARRAAEDEPSPSVLAAIDVFITERDALVEVIKRLEASCHAARRFESRWDVMFMGFNPEVLQQPMPVLDRTVDFVGWLKRQSLEVVRAEAQKMKDWRAILESRLEHLEPMLSFAAQPIGDQCKDILRVLASRIEQLESQSRKRSASTHRKPK